MLVLHVLEQKQQLCLLAATKELTCQSGPCAATDDKMLLMSINGCACVPVYALSYWFGICNVG
jgi:hypothetical protein